MTWQPASVVYPDIELVLTGRYRAALVARGDGTVHVDTKTPNPRPSRMLIVRRDGGTQADLRDRPRVTLLVWSSDEQDANDLAALVMALGPTFADGAPIIAVPTSGRSGPYPVPNESKQYLRQMSIEFHTRGVPL